MQESIRSNPAEPHHSQSNFSNCQEPGGAKQGGPGGHPRGTHAPPSLGRGCGVPRRVGSRAPIACCTQSHSGRPWTSLAGLGLWPPTRREAPRPRRNCRHESGPPGPHQDWKQSGCEASHPTSRGRPVGPAGGLSARVACPPISLDVTSPASQVPSDRAPVLSKATEA